ncbi:MAG: nonstructural protein [Microviridae sp.]|nr:MAG: nonstructural protein [Microviridae sp.]
MRTVIVAVRDSAMAGFAAPMAFPTTAVAHRSFVQQVNSNDPNSQLCKTPEDYELYYLADFDDESGSFVLPDGGPRVLARGKDVKAE